MGCETVDIECGGHLKLLLQKHNGGLHFEDSFIGLDLDEIKLIHSQLAGLWPFARNMDSDLLAIDEDNSVVLMDNETKEVAQ